MCSLITAGEITGDGVADILPGEDVSDQGGFRDDFDQTRV